MDIIEKGGNYGWRIMEGFHCYDPPAGCDTSGLELPVWEYDHSVGQSITGGYVYRGANVPELEGKYIYADYVQGQIWSLVADQSDTINTLLNDTGHSISSFGTDQHDELYICTFNGDDSKIYEFEPTVTSVLQGKNDNLPQKFQLGQNYPNPFNGATKIPYRITGDADVQLNIYDLAGNLVRSLVNKKHRPGVYEAIWEDQDISSGTYFYRLIVNRKIMADRQMTYLK